MTDSVSFNELADEAMRIWDGCSAKMQTWRRLRTVISGLRPRLRAEGMREARAIMLGAETVTEQLRRIDEAIAALSPRETNNMPKYTEAQWRAKEQNTAALAWDAGFKAGQKAVLSPPPGAEAMINDTSRWGPPLDQLVKKSAPAVEEVLERVSKSMEFDSPTGFAYLRSELATAGYKITAREPTEEDVTALVRELDESRGTIKALWRIMWDRAP